MEPGPSQVATTPPSPPPPTGTDVEHVELQVLPAGLPATVEPPPGNGDPDNTEENEVDTPPPLGVKLTGYRLLNLVVLLAFGAAKFVLSLQGQSVAPTGLDWISGSMLACLLYWIGLYETVEPPKWEWFLHADWAPAIGFSLKCFLGGLLQAFVLYWTMLPFCLFIGIPVLALLHFSKFNVSSATYVLFPWLFVAFLIFVHPEKWRVWSRMWVWPPIRSFFQKYGSNYPTRRRYRLPGKAGFIIGLLSGLLLTSFLPLVLMQHFLYVRSRLLPVEPP